MNKRMFKLFAALILSVFLFSCAKSNLHNNKTAAEAAGPQKKNTVEQSIYQVAGTWTDQHGEAIPLGKLAGKVQVTAMIFTHCGYACPKIIENMKAIEAGLPRSLKNKVDFLLISFDAQKDTSARLSRYADQLQLGGNWTLLHGDMDQVRIMSMLLQVQYSPLEGGGFNHTNAITILDENGAVSRRIEGLDINIDGALAAVKETVKG